MGTGLWTPPGSRVPMLRLPEGDVRLPDGRRLRFLDRPHGPDMLESARWTGPKNLTVVASLDDTGAHGVLLHVSLSYPDRDPTWADMKAVKAAFFGPDVDAMLPLPRDENYVAGVPGWEDSHVFHIVQMPRTWGMR